MTVAPVAGLLGFTLDSAVVIHQITVWEKLDSILVNLHILACEVEACLMTGFTWLILENQNLAHVFQAP